MFNIRQVEVAAGWQMLVGDTPFVLSKGVIEQCMWFVRGANAAFAHEDTAAWRLLGEPSACGRLDFTIVGSADQQLTVDGYNGCFPLLDGIVRPYEWEERPGGKGVTHVINGEFADAFAHVRKDWPHTRIVVEEGRRGYDDHLWAGEENISIGPGVPDDGALVLVRAEPDQTQYYGLGERSISTLQTKGDKSYGARLGWWHEVTSLGELPAPGTGTVVLKPTQGSKTKGLLIAAANTRARQQGMVTRTKLERSFLEQVAKHGRMYLQPWYPPIACEGSNMILRVFFARGFSSPGWTCLGGVWNLRHNAVVHGATDTIFGPAILG